MGQSNSKVFFLILLLITVVFAVYESYQHLSESYLWYDEAGQFFISKGLNHYSIPYTESSNSLKDVLFNNRHFNKDPGGFSILLHFWSLISNEFWYLRLLPLVFFLCCVLGAYNIAKIEVKDTTLPLVICGLLFVTPAVGAHIAEIRAYSMELCGISVAVLFLLNRVWEKSYLLLFFYSLFLAFFCTSRYGFIINSFAIVLYCIYQWILGRNLGYGLKRIIIIGLPLCITVLLVYLISMRFQSSSVEHMDYANYIKDDWRILFKPLSILFYINIVILYLDSQKNRISELGRIVVWIGTVYFILSLLGLYPWDNTRSISITFLFFANIIVSICRYLKHFKYGEVGILASYVLIVIIITYSGYNLHHDQERNSFREFCRVVEDRIYKEIFVDMHAVPDIRYQYEYGALKKHAKQDGYPNRFVFQTGPEHSHTDIEPVSINETSPDAYNCDVFYFPDGIPDNLTKQYKLVSGYNSIYELTY